MLHSLRLINWRSHSDSLLEFRKGTNLLVGLMGAGKSSVLDGLCFALFGTFPAVEHRKMKLEDLIRLNENECKVILELIFENSSYRIERKCSKTRKGTVSDAEVYKNNTLIDKGPAAVTDYLEHLLRVDYDLFTRAIYSEQNNIDYFLTVDPRRRKEEVDVLLGLDKFENARGNAVSLINRLKSNRKILETKFNRERLEEYVKSKKEKEERLLVLEKEIEGLKRQLDSEKETLVKNEETLFILRKKRQEFEVLNKRKVELDGNINLLKKQTEEKEVDEKELVELGKKKSDVESRINEIMMQLNYLENDYRVKTKDSAILEVKLKNSERNLLEIADADKQLAKLLEGSNRETMLLMQKQCDNNVVTHRAEHQTLASYLKELSELDGKKIVGELCPFCGGQLSKEKVAHAAQERTAKMAETKKRMAELNELLVSEIRKSEELSKTIKNTEMIDAKLSTLRSQMENIEAIKTRHASLSAELRKITDARNERNKELLELNSTNQKLAVSLSEYSALLIKKKQLGEIMKSLGETMAKIAMLAFSEQEFEDLRKNVEQQKISYEKLNGKLRTMELEVKSISELLGALQKEITHLSSMELEMTKLAELEEEFVIYKNILAETQTTLRTNLIEAINGAMNEIWHIFYPYKDLKALRLNVTEKDYEFEVYDGEWKTIESICSGGERACAALTLRVALAMVLTPNLSWLILDEPTHNLDKEAVELLSQTLQFKVPEVVEQTFVITHEEGLMGSEFASSYKLKRDKENFGATIVERI